MTFCGKLTKILNLLKSMESKTFVADSFNDATRIVNDIIDESFGEVLVFETLCRC